MKINTKIRYGLRMLVILGQEGSLLSTAELGRRMMVSPKYLRKLAGPIEKAGLIRSVQGVYGGYQLNKPPSEIAVLDLFTAFDEPIQILGCKKGECCSMSADCLTRPLWKNLEGVLVDQLRKTTLSALIQGEKFP
jgi:Rrf2 family protein